MKRDEVLKEIEQSRKKAFEDFLVDIGYDLTEEEKRQISEKNALWRKKQVENISNIVKYPAVCVDKIKEAKLRKEEEYYKKKIEEMLAKKN